VCGGDIAKLQQQRFFHWKARAVFRERDGKMASVIALMRYSNDVLNKMNIPLNYWPIFLQKLKTLMSLVLFLRIIYIHLYSHIIRSLD